MPAETANSDTDVFRLLALEDAELEAADLVRMNLSVARGIPRLANLDIDRYCGIVDDWTEQFLQWLPRVESRFHRTPAGYMNDIRFFRAGMLAVFLGSELGLDYIEEQKHVHAIRYTNPSDLFLNGLIDSRRGTCGNMSTLHVAIGRRLGWPVSLACLQSHALSRFDDGRLVFNIEASKLGVDSFSGGTDEDYIRKFALPRRAVSCGSDLRRLSAREMLGLFLALRGRHFMDTQDIERAETTCCLSRSVFPQYRVAYIASVYQMVLRGQRMFDAGEFGHPQSLYETLAQTYAPPELRLIKPAVAQLPTAPQVRRVYQSDDEEITQRAEPKQAGSAFSKSTIQFD